MLRPGGQVCPSLCPAANSQVRMAVGVGKGVGGEKEREREEEGGGKRAL